MIDALVGLLAEPIVLVGVGAFLFGGLVGFKAAAVAAVVLGFGRRLVLGMAARWALLGGLGAAGIGLETLLPGFLTDVLEFLPF